MQCRLGSRVIEHGLVQIGRHDSDVRQRRCHCFSQDAGPRCGLQQSAQLQAGETGDEIVGVRTINAGLM